MTNKKIILKNLREDQPLAISHHEQIANFLLYVIKASDHSLNDVYNSYIAQSCFTDHSDITSGDSGDYLIDTRYFLLRGLLDESYFYLNNLNVKNVYVHGVFNVIHTITAVLPNNDTVNVYLQGDYVTIDDPNYDHLVDDQAQALKAVKNILKNYI